MNALGDCAQDTRPMIDRVHRCNHGEQNLRGTNVTRRFVAADMLLARLQREAVSRTTFGIVRNADESPWHVAFVLLSRGKKRGVRSTETEWNAETLCAPDRNIGAEFTWGFQQRERENVRRDNDKRAGGVRLIREMSVIVNRAVRRGILNECAENSVVEFEFREVVDFTFDAERFRARANNFDRFGVTIVRDEKYFPIWNRRVTKRHRFGRGRR